MRDFKLYKSRDALYEDFLTGKMLSGVIVKSPDCDENIYVCHDERKNSQIIFERVRFNDEKGDVQDSIYIMRLVHFHKKNRTVSCFS
jgi:hypothetical protein